MDRRAGSDITCDANRGETLCPAGSISYEKMLEAMKEKLKSIVLTRFATTRSELLGVAIFIGVIWCIFLADHFLPVDKMALAPRDWRGLPGVVAMPFLHEDLAHLVGNSIPLAILLLLMVFSRNQTGKIVALIILVSGLILWVAGFSGNSYVGSSMLVFGLIGFLFSAGLIEKRPIPLIISLVVALMYGGTFLWGLLPLDKNRSELAHFYGAVAGVALAFLWCKPTGHSEPLESSEDA